MGLATGLTGFSKDSIQTSNVRPRSDGMAGSTTSEMKAEASAEERSLLTFLSAEGSNRMPLPSKQSVADALRTSEPKTLSAFSSVNNPDSHWSL